MFKMAKTIISIIICLGLVIGFLFGTDGLSYGKTLIHRVQCWIRGEIPIEFELHRARDLLENEIPRIHAQMQQICSEEVDLAILRAEILESSTALRDERGKIEVLTAQLETKQPQILFAGRQYSPDQVKNELANRFKRLKEGENLLASKKQLLSSRENCLSAALKELEKSRQKKLLLEGKVEMLAARYRIVKAASIGSKFHPDSGKLDRTEKALGDLEKRVAVAEQVLARESQGIETFPDDTIEATDLVTEVHAYFQKAGQTNEVVVAE